MTNIIIVGGGFGGVRAALNLANRRGVHVKLISDKTYFEYHAALYRSATGRSPLEVAIPLVEFFEYAKNVEVLKDEIVGIDPEEQKIAGKADTKEELDAALDELEKKKE